MPTFAHSLLTLDAIPAVLSTVRSWEAPHGCSSGLHAGDIGWQLAWPDDESLPAVHLWQSAGGLAAVGIADGPGEWRVRTDSVLAQDPGLATVLAADLADLLGDGAASVDLPSGPILLATLLVSAGFTSGDTVWQLLYRSLDTRHATGRAVGPVRPDELADRAAAHASAFSAFGGSRQPDLTRWPRLRARPGFDPSLDLVARTPEGRVAAGATAWSAGPDRCGLLEPVATHLDYQGQGYGWAVIEGACGALTEAGASGVRVHTPAFNSAAVATYLACGFVVIERTTALVRPAR